MSEATKSGRNLISATRKYAKEDKAKSWWYTLSTFGLWIFFSGLAVILPSWPAQTASAMIAGMIFVRAFILYHDHVHGALLSRSKGAKMLFSLHGLYQMTPRTVWKETHNYHHAHTAKIAGSHIGSYMMVTTRMWNMMTPMQKLKYKLSRHPLTIFFGVFTVFVLGMLVSSLVRDPKKNWDSLASLLLHAGLATAVPHFFGWNAYFFGIFLPLAVTCAMGACLFYAQHNFPDVHIVERKDWEYSRAALESSSFMDMSPLMHWFTGNIGYHHIHHLNPSIPFYRLPEVMRDMPETQNPVRVRLTFKSMIECFKLKLWDPKQGKMVGYP